MEDRDFRAMAIQGREKPDNTSERKRRRVSIADTSGLTKDILEQMLEKSFQATEERLFAEYEPRMDQIIEQRLQDFEERRKTKVSTETSTKAPSAVRTENCSY
jgi:DNA-binding protein H-NS